MAVNLTIVTGEVGHSLMAAKYFSYALQQPMNIRPLQAACIEEWSVQSIIQGKYHDRSYIISKPTLSSIRRQSFPFILILCCNQ